MLVYRENTEGEYAPGGPLYPGTEHEIAVQNRRVHAPRLRADPAGRRSRRPARPAQQAHRASPSQRPGVGSVLWDDVFDAVRKDYPDVQSRSLLVDAPPRWTSSASRRRSTWWWPATCSATSYGPEAACHRQHRPGGRREHQPDAEFPSMFEPVHGSAPDIAGKRHRQPAGGGAVGRADARLPRPSRCARPHRPRHRGAAVRSAGAAHRRHRRSRGHDRCRPCAGANCQCRIGVRAWLVNGVSTRCHPLVTG